MSFLIKTVIVHSYVNAKITGLPRFSVPGVSFCVAFQRTSGASSPAFRWWRWWDLGRRFFSMLKKNISPYINGIYGIPMGYPENGFQWPCNWNPWKLEVPKPTKYFWPILLGRCSREYPHKIWRNISWSISILGSWTYHWNWGMYGKIYSCRLHLAGISH